jgi:hypothetical protein
MDKDEEKTATRPSNLVSLMISGSVSLVLKKTLKKSKIVTTNGKENTLVTSNEAVRYYCILCCFVSNMATILFYMSNNIFYSSVILTLDTIISIQSPTFLIRSLQFDSRMSLKSFLRKEQDPYMSIVHP